MAKKLPAINSTSTADIAFIILIFFLMTTTMNVDSGIQRQLPPMPPEQQEPIDINKRNILLVFVSASNDIMVGGERMDIAQIKDRVKDFVLNPSQDPTLSDVEVTEIENLGNYPVSKGIVSLQNDRGTNYGTYIQVQNELTRAFSEIRDQVSLRYYGKSFDDLNDINRKAITLAVPQKISEAEPRNIGGL
ncbi:biopolymer transporter ExbD [Alistipes sp. OttesenSCG-928-L06]|nr:biopolymer transporter ExbD [Alistipes sp. OttesenSCG-928-L06]